MATSAAVTTKIVFKISSRISSIFDSNPKLNTWILATHSWNDKGKWLDTEFWQD